MRKVKNEREAFTEIAFIVNDYRHEEINSEEAIEQVADISAQIAELTEKDNHKT